MKLCTSAMLSTYFTNIAKTISGMLVVRDRVILECDGKMMGSLFVY